MPKEFRLVSKLCKNCGVQLVIRNTRDIERRNFCSPSCRGKFYANPEQTREIQKKSNTPEANAKKSHKGENHPKWIADRSKLASPRSMAEFKWWRSEVFKQDNYSCVECGEYGGVLQAHHKAPVCVFQKYKFEIWNGITVCKPCHNEIHRAANELFKTGGYFNRLKEKQIAF